jgi:hypothetical protein
MRRTQQKNLNLQTTIYNTIFLLKYQKKGDEKANYFSSPSQVSEKGDEKANYFLKQINTV